MTVASIRYVSPWFFFFFSFFLSFHLYHSSIFFKLSLQCCGCRAEIIFPVFVTNTWSLSCLIQFLRNHWENWIVLLLCLNCYTFIKVIEIGKTMFLGLRGWSWGLGVLPQENWCFWQDISQYQSILLSSVHLPLAAGVSQPASTACRERRGWFGRWACCLGQQLSLWHLLSLATTG